MTSADLFRCVPVPHRWRLAVLLVCAGLGLSRAAGAQEARDPLSVKGPVLVLAFEPLPGTQGGRWLREGLPLLLADALKARGADVFGRDARVEAFERLQLPSQLALSRASALRVGEMLGAGTVVVGQVALTGTSVEIRARSIILSPAGLSPEVVVTRPVSGLFEAVTSVATTLAGATAASGTWTAPPSVAAFAGMVEGLTAETVEDRERYLQASLKLAPDYGQARLALWSLLRDTGRHRAALASVSPVPQASADYREARYAAALSLIDLKRYDEAFRELRDLLKQQPVAAVSNALGVVQMRRTPTPQTGEPTYYFNQAVELDPDEADLYFNLGYAYGRSRDAQGSAYWMREAVRRNPADAEAHWVLGSALLQLGATVEGERERTLARQLAGDDERWGGPAGAPGVPAGLERLSPRLQATRRRGQPLDAPSNAAERTSLARFHLDAGRRAFERGDDREATAALRRATFLSPYMAEAHLLLGRIYLRVERIDEAVAALRIALWIEDDPDTRQLLSEAVARQRPSP
jgi:tetratricopeptide (TPR) repeat protein